MFICLKCDLDNITGYMKVLENNLNIMLMLDYEVFKENIEIAIGETENNIFIPVPIDTTVLTECEKGVRLKITSNYPNNLKGNSKFIILFKVNKSSYKMIDENDFEKYDSRKIENFIDFLEFRNINSSQNNIPDKVENDTLNDVIDDEVEEFKNKIGYSSEIIENELLEEVALCEPELVYDLSSSNDLNTTSELKETDILPSINSFFKDKTISLDISIKRAFINAVLSFLSEYNTKLKNTFIFKKEDGKEIEFIKIKMKEIKDKDNIFLILIENMIDELKFSNIATHIYLGIEKDSKESIAILLALSKETFKTVENSIYESNIRVLETGLKDEFHYIVYECLI